MELSVKTSFSFLVQLCSFLCARLSHALFKLTYHQSDCCCSTSLLYSCAAQGRGRNVAHTSLDLPPPLGAVLVPTVCASHPWCCGVERARSPIRTARGEHPIITQLRAALASVGLGGSCCPLACLVAAGTARCKWGANRMTHCESKFKPRESS